jgi:YesN/AraC family two-component response regulator
VCVENGQAALDWLADKVPALILLDLLMPGVDGFAGLEQVRSDSRNRNVPVVIVSGKLLTFEDIQRLNHSKSVLLPKGFFNPAETAAFLEQVQVEAIPLPQPTSQLVKQSLAFMHQHYAEPLSRKELADAIGISENYLSQIFHQEMTISPWDYLNRFRIQKAKSLLLNSTDKVTVIATKVGFNDSAYFSRVFRKITGIAPQEFRHTS